jgi:hypothetical protein
MEFLAVVRTSGEHSDLLLSVSGGQWPQRRSESGRSVLTWTPAARGLIIANPIILLRPKFGLYHHFENSITLSALSNVSISHVTLC